MAGGAALSIAEHEEDVKAGPGVRSASYRRSLSSTPEKTARRARKKAGSMTGARGGGARWAVQVLIHIAASFCYDCLSLPSSPRRRDGLFHRRTERLDKPLIKALQIPLRIAAHHDTHRPQTHPPLQQAAH